MRVSFSMRGEGAVDVSTLNTCSRVRTTSAGPDWVVMYFMAKHQLYVPSATSPLLPILPSVSIVPQVELMSLSPS